MIGNLDTEGFVFGKYSTADFDMHVERYPKIIGPARRMEDIVIPGRTGVLHIDEGAYDNYTQEYEVYYHGFNSAPVLAHKIKEWLLTSAGYQRLIDAYDSEHYRMAVYRGPLDIANQLNRYGRATIAFDCCAKMFLRTGEHPVTLADECEIFNPTSCPADPLITVYGTEGGELHVGGTTVQILAITDEISVDCESMNAYRKVGDVLENMNGNIFAQEFPKLHAGSTNISWSGGITKVEIIPRWWTL